LRKRPDDDLIDDKEMPLLEHLSELRQRLLWCVGGFFIAFLVCYYFSDLIFWALAQPLADLLQKQSGQERRFIFTALYEAFFTYVKVAFWGALMISFPLTATQLWMFISPGLYRREQRAIQPFLWATPVLFAMGASLAYFFIIPLAWRFFLSFESPGGGGGLPIQLEAKVNEYLSLVMQLIFAFGFAFLLPVLLVLLCRVGILTPEGLAKNRRYAIVGCFVVAAVITPPDVISQVGLAVPLMLLYEASIWTARWMTPKDDEAAA